ncbi:MAG: histidine--tRNA ligase [Alphaproteobacteria bacterium]|nr:histidine--tRNA ligase [Alphaproteobacteria bacterium]
MFRPVRGMKDLYGVSVNKYNFIIERAKHVGMKYGYNIISTPLVEYTEVFQRSIGDETDVVSKEMYTFSDKGDESVTLRPEGTAGIMRAIVSEGMTQSLPLKFMYYGEMFRYDRPQKGRYRQFHQLGFEHVGDKSPYTDALLIAMASEILGAIGVFDFKVLVNTLGDEETRKDYTKGLVKYLSRHEDNLSDDSRRRLEKNPLRVLDSKDERDREICAMAPLISDYLSKESGQYFEHVCELLAKCGVNYEIDNFLVRGLDYYSETAFEFKPTDFGFKDSFGGGGRYDHLLSVFGGPDVSGIGFAFGIERLMIMLDNSKFTSTPAKIAVIPVSEGETEAAFELVWLLYNCDIPAEFLHLGNVSKKMKVANRLECSIALILGEEELKNGTVTVKFMNAESGALKEKVVNRNGIIRFLRHNI